MIVCLRILRHHSSVGLLELQSSFRRQLSITSTTVVRLALLPSEFVTSIPGPLLGRCKSFRVRLPFFISSCSASFKLGYQDALLHSSWDSKMFVVGGPPVVPWLVNSLVIERCWFKLPWRHSFMVWFYPWVCLFVCKILCVRVLWRSGRPHCFVS